MYQITHSKIIIATVVVTNEKDCIYNSFMAMLYEVQGQGVGGDGAGDDAFLQVLTSSFKFAQI